MSKRSRNALSLGSTSCNESLTSRFARLADLLTQRIFRLIDEDGFALIALPLGFNLYVLHQSVHRVLTALLNE
jgi:hypothetical protein